MPYTENNGTKIYWEEHGKGDDLLLIMGLGGNLHLWHRTLPVMSQHYRTIVFDNRGVGKSDAPAGPYPIPVMAADAAAVMDAAGVRKAHVFGVSMGGIIAQELALQRPEKTRSLVLGCTTHGGPESVPAKPEVINVLMARGQMTAEQALQAMVPFIYNANTPRERLEEDLEVRRHNLATAESYYAQLQGILEYESRTRLSQITAPTIVVHGETDELIPPENGRLIARLIPGAKLAMIAQASHIFMTDQPEESNEIILEFLSHVH